MPRTLRIPAALTALGLGGSIASALAMRGMTDMDGPGSTASFLCLLWMAAVGAVIFVEKVTSVGARASVPIAVALAGAAVWVAT